MYGVAALYCFYPDVDECRTGEAGCSEVCENTLGGYRCSCPTGLILMSDDHNCTGWVTFILCTARKLDLCDYTLYRAVILF